MRIAGSWSTGRREKLASCFIACFLLTITARCSLYQRKPTLSHSWWAHATHTRALRRLHGSAKWEKPSPPGHAGASQYSVSDWARSLQWRWQRGQRSWIIVDCVWRRWLALASCTWRSVGFRVAVRKTIDAAATPAHEVLWCFRSRPSGKRRSDRRWPRPVTARVFAWLASMQRVFASTTRGEDGVRPPSLWLVPPHSLEHTPCNTP